MPQLESLCKLTCSKMLCLKRRPISESKLKNHIGPAKPRKRNRDRRSFSVDFQKEEFSILDELNLFLLAEHKTKKEWLVEKIEAEMQQSFTEKEAG